jgi:photosystem II stability/assembly factor-like uncharacterized protein
MGAMMNKDRSVQARVFLAAAVAASMFGYAGTRASQVTARITDVGPEIGLNFSYEGFLIHRRDSRQVLGSSVKNGVFKSVNGGQTWRRSSAGLESARVQPLAVSGLRADPNEPSTVYLIAESGVYRSTDFGDRWSRLPTDGLDTDVIDVAIHPTEPGVLFVLSSSGLVSPLQKSTDAGLTIAPFGTGLPLAESDDPDAQDTEGGFRNLEFSRADPSIIYIVQNGELHEQGVFKSTDGGATFAALDGAPEFPAQVFPHPTDPDVVFLQTLAGATGLFVSRDGGTSFEEITDNITPGASSFVAFDPSSSSTMYFASSSGLFRSTDGGHTFAQAGLTPEQIGAFAATMSVDPNDSRVIYANTDNGNFKSVDAGGHFAEINSGWTAAAVSALAFDHRAAPRLLIGALGRLYRSGSRGAHDEQIENGFPRAQIASIATGVSDPDFMIVATRTRGIQWSQDAGGSWTRSTIDDGTRPVPAAIAIDPLDANNVYFVASQRLYRSVDGAQSFQRAVNAPPGLASVALHPVQPNVMYAGTSFQNPGRFWISSDYGQTFASMSIPYDVSRITRLLIQPRDPRVLYLLGTFQNIVPPPPFPGPTPPPGPLPPPPQPPRILRSTDGGLTFAPADVGLWHGSILNAVVDPDKPLTLYGWVEGSGLAMSVDGGNSWMSVDEGETRLRSGGLGPSAAMVINPSKPRLIYLGGASVLEVEVR